MDVSRLTVGRKVYQNPKKEFISTEIRKDLLRSQLELDSLTLANTAKRFEPCEMPLVPEKFSKKMSPIINMPPGALTKRQTGSLSGIIKEFSEKLNTFEPCGLPLNMKEKFANFKKFAATTENFSEFVLKNLK